MANRFEEERDADLGGYYARDPHPRDFGGDYARERWWGGMGSRYRGRGPKNYRRPDDLIAEDVHRVLTDDDQLDATNIEVKVEDGEVTLSGIVSDRWAKRHAEDIVARCRGVHDVQNRLAVEERIGKASEN
jgi:hypothetical protein